MAAIVAGTAIGVAVGDRLGQKTTRIVTDALGLVVLMLGGLDVASITDASVTSAVGSSAGPLIVLGAMVIGGVVGSIIGIEARLDQFGSFLKNRFARGAGTTTFVEGFVSASLLFCVGPLSILGALQDGLGDGISQLALKSTLDGVTAIAIAASLGWGVGVAALPVIAVQGSFTVVGAVLGRVMPDSAISIISATGGLVLVALAIRLLRLRDIAVGDLLPALVLAPALLGIVAALR